MFTPVYIVRVMEFYYLCMRIANGTYTFIAKLHKNYILPQFSHALLDHRVVSHATTLLL